MPDIPFSDEVRLYGDERRHHDVMDALLAIAERLEVREPIQIPLPPVIHADPIDTELLGRVIAAHLPQDRSAEVTSAFETVAKELKGIGKKLRALGMPIVAGPVPIEGGSFEVTNLPAIYQTKPQPREHRLDYATRTDANPVYVGEAEPGTSTSAATWQILRLSYDSNNRLVRKELQPNASWDNRAVGW